MLARGPFGAVVRLLRGPRERVALDYLLAHADPSASLSERVAWLTELLLWIRLHQGPRPPTDSEAVTAEAGSATSGGAPATQRALAEDVLRIRVARVRFLLRLLDRHPQWKGDVARTLRSILRDAHGLRLFASTGLAQAHGFWSEVVHRMSSKVLPEPPLGGDLAQVFVALFPDADDGALMLAFPPETRADVRTLFRFQEPVDEACWTVVRRDIEDAIVMLSTQVAAAGLSESVRSRAGSGALVHSPFVALGPAAEAYLVACRDGADDAARDAARTRLFAEIDACRRLFDEVMTHLEEFGVSVELVYRVALARQQLDRIHELVTLATGGDATSGAVGRFAAELIRETHARRSVTALFRTNLYLLTRKIAERTGHTGEHYITRNQVEYVDMLRSAGKGGAVTGVTVLGKFAIVGAGLAPFFEGVAASLNYALSFCAIQFIHGTLATKQPAMTASAMAAKLKRARHRGRLREFVEEVANLTRSQVAAIAGNLVFVVPGALLFQGLWLLLGGARVPDPEKARHTLESLNILGATPIYAAATGVLLWISAILSGWLENWATFRRLPEAIAQQPRWVYAFGAPRMRRVATWFEDNVAGLGGNIALGLMLGMTPVVAAFFGLPFDVRHVTLATGSVALSASTLGLAVFTTPTFWLACAGIVVVGVLNLSVSFALALWVAIRSTGAGQVSRRRVFRAVMMRFFAAPHDFLLPPRRARAAIPSSAGLS